MPGGAAAAAGVQSGMRIVGVGRRQVFDTTDDTAAALATAPSTFTLWVAAEQVPVHIATGATSPYEYGLARVSPPPAAVHVATGYRPDLAGGALRAELSPPRMPPPVDPMAELRSAMAEKGKDDRRRFDEMERCIKTLQDARAELGDTADRRATPPPVDDEGGLRAEVAALREALAEATGGGSVRELAEEVAELKGRQAELESTVAELREEQREAARLAALAEVDNAASLQRMPSAEAVARAGALLSDIRADRDALRDAIESAQQYDRMRRGSVDGAEGRMAQLESDIHAVRALQEGLQALVLGQMADYRTDDGATLLPRGDTRVMQTFMSSGLPDGLSSHPHAAPDALSHDGVRTEFALRIDEPDSDVQGSRRDRDHDGASSHGGRNPTDVGTEWGHRVGDTLLSGSPPEDGATQTETAVLDQVHLSSFSPASELAAVRTQVELQAAETLTHSDQQLPACDSGIRSHVELQVTEATMHQPMAVPKPDLSSAARRGSPRRKSTSKSADGRHSSPRRRREREMRERERSRNRERDHILGSIDQLRQEERDRQKEWEEGLEKREQKVGRALREAMDSLGGETKGLAGRVGSLDDRIVATAEAVEEHRSLTEDRFREMEKRMAELVGELGPGGGFGGRLEEVQAKLDAEIERRQRRASDVDAAAMREAVGVSARMEAAESSQALVQQEQARQAARSAEVAAELEELKDGFADLQGRLGAAESAQMHEQRGAAQRFDSLTAAIERVRQDSASVAEQRRSAADLQRSDSELRADLARRVAALESDTARLLPTAEAGSHAAAELGRRVGALETQQAEFAQATERLDQAAERISEQQTEAARLERSLGALVDKGESERARRENEDAGRQREMLRLLDSRDEALRRRDEEQKMRFTELVRKLTDSMQRADRSAAESEVARTLVEKLRSETRQRDRALQSQLHSTLEGLAAARSAVQRVCDRTEGIDARLDMVERSGGRAFAAGRELDARSISPQRRARRHSPPPPAVAAGRRV
eukprot:TRINITY_DN16981_c0_g1_i1.p1 TRINITY_DN16981_c0_g1~~TRINITY_DN16981_c0_g1_i1.p1  ORF type:complete len:1062 (+),score=365.79 TRINITY_DN16981_c0_g1_i1:173-3187(+)